MKEDLNGAFVDLCDFIAAPLTHARLARNVLWLYPFEIKYKGYTSAHCIFSKAQDGFIALSDDPCFTGDTFWIDRWPCESRCAGFHRGCGFDWKAHEPEWGRILCSSILWWRRHAAGNLSWHRRGIRYCAAASANRGGKGAGARASAFGARRVSGGGPEDLRDLGKLAFAWCVCCWRYAHRFACVWRPNQSDGHSRSGLRD